MSLLTAAWATSLELLAVMQQQDVTQELGEHVCAEADPRPDHMHSVSSYVTTDLGVTAFLFVEQCNRV